MIAILASGDGSNFEALASHFQKQISTLICNVEGAFVLKRAEKYHIPHFLIPHKNFSSRVEHEKEIVAQLKSFSALKLIVLAGYMRVLSPYFFKELGHILTINLHPAHLQEYKGAHAYEYATFHKYPRWGLSIHKVTEELDSGTLLNSIEFEIYPYETVEDIKKRVKILEHKLLVNTVAKIIKKEE